MAPNLVSKKKAGPQKVAVAHKFVVDFSGPADNKIFDEAAFEKFMIDSIKVEGKTGNLGEDVKVVKEAPGTLTVYSSIPMSKRYIKYLSKRFLKRNSLREWLRVVSTSPTTYTLKFFDTEEAADDEE